MIEQFTELDPDFPNHEPDPALKQTVEALGARVRKEKADLGFAFDGDGDRMGVVDEKGDVIWPDRYMILLARQVLEKQPGAKIVFDVKVSQALEEDIAAHGGIPIMWKTGHSHIKAKLHEEKAALAGEMSGHIFFVQNYYGFDDGIYAGLRFAEYVSEVGKPVSEIIAGTPYYISTPAIDVDCPDDKKYEVVDKLTAEFKRDFPRVVDINGARVIFEDGWGLVRASSNLPVLVLRFEAKTQEAPRRDQDALPEVHGQVPRDREGLAQRVVRGETRARLDGARREVIRVAVSIWRTIRDARFSRRRAGFVFVVCAFAGAAIAFAAALPAGYLGEKRSSEILAKTVTIRLDPDLSQLTPGEKEAVGFLLEAGAVLQDLYETLASPRGEDGVRGASPSRRGARSPRGHPQLDRSLPPREGSGDPGPR